MHTPALRVATKVAASIASWSGTQGSKRPKRVLSSDPAAAPRVPKFRINRAIAY
jgi:hypothetical protein